MRSANVARKSIEKNHVDGFILPSVDLRVSERERSATGGQTIVEFLEAHRAGNETRARENAESVARGETLGPFAFLRPAYDGAQLRDRLGGRPAAMWWDEGKSTATLCVCGDAEFVLVLGQEYWPLVRIDSPGPTLWAGSFYIPDRETADVILRVFLARDSDSILEHPFATCSLSGRPAVAAERTAFAWRQGTTIYQECADTPFPGSCVVTHFSDGAVAGATHVVIGDGDLVWMTAQWLSALEYLNEGVPVVVIGIGSNDQDAWCEVRDEVLSQPASPLYRRYVRSVRAVLESLDTFTADSPLVYAGFSLGGSWALRQALTDSRATAGLAVALAAPVEGIKPANAAVRIRLVECVLDESTRRTIADSYAGLMDLGIVPERASRNAGHSAEIFPLALAEFLHED